MADRAIDHALLEALIAPASACALGFAARRSEMSVEEKSPGQFASEADRTVEQIIRRTLFETLGDVALLGEEEGGGLDADETGWVIDPIDGTTNFLRGLPLWGISIGYVIQGAPMAGVVTLPDLGIVLSAVERGGIRCNGASFERPQAHGAVRLIALGENDFEPGDVTDERARSLREAGFAVARYNCAVFALTSAALGWTDGYIEHGCGLWDIAAGAVICREAGLAVTCQAIAPDRWSIDAHTS